MRNTEARTANGEVPSQSCIDFTPSSVAWVSLRTSMSFTHDSVFSLKQPLQTHLECRLNIDPFFLYILKLLFPSRNYYSLWFLTSTSRNITVVGQLPWEGRRKISMFKWKENGAHHLMFFDEFFRIILLYQECIFVCLCFFRKSSCSARDISIYWSGNLLECWLKIFIAENIADLIFVVLFRKFDLSTSFRASLQEFLYPKVVREMFSDCWGLSFKKILILTSKNSISEKIIITSILSAVYLRMI